MTQSLSADAKFPSTRPIEVPNAAPSATRRHCDRCYPPTQPLNTEMMRRDTSVVRFAIEQKTDTPPEAPKSENVTPSPPKSPRREAWLSLVQESLWVGFGVYYAITGFQQPLGFIGIGVATGSAAMCLNQIRALRHLANPAKNDLNASVRATEDAQFTRQIALFNHGAVKIGFFGMFASALLNSSTPKGFFSLILLTGAYVTGRSFFRTLTTLFKESSDNTLPYQSQR